VRNGKKYLIDKNFYPGYLLIESNLDGEVQHLIEKTTNVIGFLKDGKKPTPLRDVEVKRILNQIDEEKKTEIDVPYVIDEYVGIINGPFTSFNGIITHIDSTKKRVKVDVKIFGRSTPVELEFHQISKI
jgi:transcriptional antiterminator NusG